MSSEPKPPKRAVVLELKVQGDDRAEVANALRQIADDLDLKFINGPNGCSGGSRSSWSYDFSESTYPTHDVYIELLHQYLAAIKT